MYNYFNLLVQEKKSFKGFSIFSSGGHLVQRSGAVLSNFGRESLKEQPVKLFQNPSSCTGGEVV